MPTVTPERLEAWCRSMIAATGASEKVARIVARSLVSADLRGHSSHGVRLLPKYVERTGTSPDGDVNRIDPAARPRVEAREGARALVDGNAAFGRVVGHDATELAIEVADEQGLAVVGVRDANHLGRMGEWAETAAEAGLLFLAFVKAEAQLVAPPGTATRRLSTNPIAASAPTFGALEFPIVLDMATSVAAGGKVLERERTDRELPDGWALGDDGGTMEEPGPFVDGDGALLPLGGTTAGHKGFGLAVVAELFGAIIGNGVVAGQREHVPYNNSAALLAVDPTWFTPERTIADRVRMFAEYVREARPIPGVSPGAAADGGVFLPGEPEHRSERMARRSGLSLPEETIRDLNRCAEQFGLEPLEPE